MRLRDLIDDLMLVVFLIRFICIILHKIL